MMEDRRNAIHVSLAALWEMAVKAANGKLPFYSRLTANGSSSLMAYLDKQNFKLLEIGLDHALAASRLPQLHRDPFDRLMIAQALIGDLTVITSDRIFTQYAGVRILAA